VRLPLEERCTYEYLSLFAVRNRRLTDLSDQRLSLGATPETSGNIPVLQFTANHATLRAADLARGPLRPQPILFSLADTSLLS
jgi:hypothetical protein